MNAWIGVDLDGTLARYEGWKGIGHIGVPIPEMVERVKEWRSQGMEVKIFTARVANGEEALPPIHAWCLENLGEVLEVTNVKDFGMIQLWDDRAIGVEHNTGACTDVRINDAV